MNNLHDYEQLSESPFDARGEDAIVMDYIVEEQEYLDIFAKSVKEWHCLTPTAVMVLKYLLSVCEERFAWFDKDACKEYCKYNSLQSVYSGISELLAKDFIARTPLNYKFFINPCLIFKANKLTITRTYTLNNEA